VWRLVEFLPSDGAKDGRKLDVHPHSLEQTHIVYTSVSVLSNAEGLKPLQFLVVADGDVIHY
jgi:hypothetical protein